MEFRLAKGTLESTKADIVVIACFQREAETQKGAKKSPPAKLGKADGGIAIDRTFSGELGRAIEAEGFSGEEGKEKLFFTAGRIPSRYVLLVGLGPRRDFSIETLRRAGAAMAKHALNVKASSVAVSLEREALGGLSPLKRLQAVVEGVMMGSYRFDRYREGREQTKPSLATVTFFHTGPQAPLSKAIETGKTIGEAIRFARDLSNMPPNDLTPTILAGEAKRIATSEKLSYKVLGTAELKKEKMGAFLSVAQGSAEPPALVYLGYRPRGKARAKVALVGKGITFDSGGISIKPSKNMHEMKHDMSGAADVLAAMQAIARLKPAVAVDAYLAAAENLPDGKAFKPGDIVRARNGKTIEIISTDAEGRMVLADTLTLASEQKPDYLIDLATLTGGVGYAVGEIYAALIGNDQRLIDRLLKAASSAGERVWQLPLEKQYLKGITRGPADLVNSGGGNASTINASLFLSQFVGETKWAHFDIASCAWVTEETPLAARGATGMIVPTLVAFVCGL